MAYIDYGAHRIAGGTLIETEPLVIGYGKNVRIMLKQYGDLPSDR
jgi:hypothetical protein